MRYLKRGLAKTGICLWLLVTIAGVGTVSAQQELPRELVRFITRQGYRSTILDLCRDEGKDRTAARLLTDLQSEPLPPSEKPLALSEIEKALDSVGQEGEKSRFATDFGWLLFAYARIKGKEAYTRLSVMSADPKLADAGIDFDGSIALSLGITSYVSSNRGPMNLVFLCRAQEPRDTMDQFILGWEKGDPKLFEGTLGPNSRGFLTSLAANKTWEQLRREYLGPQSGGKIAVGYQFEIPGRWSEPEETLEEKRTDFPYNYQNPHLRTLFKTGSGRDCGQFEVTFLRVRKAGGESLNYAVDQPDLEDLLRVISTCARQP